MARLSRRDFLKGLAASGTVVGAQMTGGLLTRMPTAIAQDMVEVTYATPGGVAEDAAWEPVWEAFNEDHGRHSCQLSRCWRWLWTAVFAAIASATRSGHRSRCLLRDGRFHGGFRRSRRLGGRSTAMWTRTRMSIWKTTTQVISRHSAGKISFGVCHVTARPTRPFSTPISMTKPALIIQRV